MPIYPVSPKTCALLFSALAAVLVLPSMNMLASHPNIEQIFGFSRRHHDPKFQIDFTQPDSIDRACHMLSDLAPVHLVIVATGMLHDEQRGLNPEKSWRHLNANTMAANFQINSIGPALIASKVTAFTSQR